MGSCHSPPPPDKVSKVSFWQVSLTYISTPGLKVAMWDHSFVHIKWHNFVIVIKTLLALFQNFSAHIIRPQNLPEQTIINEKNRYNMKHSECVTCRANDSRVGYCFAIVWSLFIDIFCFVLFSQLDDLSLMEINVIRPFLTQALDHMHNLRCHVAENPSNT